MVTLYSDMATGYGPGSAKARKYGETRFFISVKYPNYMMNMCCLQHSKCLKFLQVVEVSGLQEGLVLELEQEGQVVAMVLVQAAQVLAHLEALEV